MNAVLHRKAQRDGGKDGDRRRPKRAETGDNGGDEKHHPGYQTDASAHHPDGAFDEPVDRAVDLRDGKKIGDSNKRQEQIAWKARENIAGFHPYDQGAEHEGAGKCQGPHIDRLNRCDDEHRNEQPYGQKFNTHDSPPSGASSAVVVAVEIIYG